MKPAHPNTREMHASSTAQLNFADTRDFDDAQRGFIGTLPDAHFLTDAGDIAWTMRHHAFIEGDAPPTVNPSLWRLSKLNAIHGLFKVTERIYQVRGFCLANMTIIEGDSGIIVIDPLTFVEHARAALELYAAHRGQRPVRAIVYTHSHRDHYGGAQGVASLEVVRTEGIRVIAPQGFLEEAFSETILAGVPMRRRSLFQFGTTLPAGPMGHVDSGLGKAVGKGRDGLIPPDWLIASPMERHVIDGVEIVFQLTPGAEAPAEMNLYYPGLRALNLAENACHTMHNLCPLRGAKTRDALAWSRYLDEALQSFVPFVDVVFAQHHWPVWGGDRIVAFVEGQRDLYRYLHDQTLRLMSHGHTPAEIGDMLMLPNHLSSQWFARGYYGTVVHNVAAIYAHYMGPYDGNPAHLNRLPPEPGGGKYVEYMGGAAAVIGRARSDFDRGEFRWVVEVLSHLLFSEPELVEARELSADAMEQLGYQSESATWRNAYLLAASELRRPRKAASFAPSSIPIGSDMLALLPLEKLLEYLAIRVNGEKAQLLRAKFDWALRNGNGTTEQQRMTLSNGALTHLPGHHGEAADARIDLGRDQLTTLLAKPAGFLEAFQCGELVLQGDKNLFEKFLMSLDHFDPMFNVVES